jgi:hypothetical protein
MKNKGGAPRKQDHLKVKNRITVSFNEAEYTVLKEKGLLDGKLVKTVILNTLNGKSLNLNTNKDPKLIVELNRIGNNINQISKKLNSGIPLSEGEKEHFFLLLRELEKIISL